MKPISIQPLICTGTRNKTAIKKLAMPLDNAIVQFDGTHIVKIAIIDNRAMISNLPIIVTIFSIFSVIPVLKIGKCSFAAQQQNYQETL